MEGGSPEHRRSDEKNVKAIFVKLKTSTSRFRRAGDDSVHSLLPSLSYTKKVRGLDPLQTPVAVLIDIWTRPSAMPLLTTLYMSVKPLNNGYHGSAEMRPLFGV